MAYLRKIHLQYGKIPSDFFKRYEIRHVGPTYMVWYPIEYTPNLKT